MSGCTLFLQLPEAEWRMRHGFPVEIIEARTDSLSSLAEWLAASGYQPRRRRVGDLGRTAPGSCVRLVEITAGESAARLAALTRRGAGEHVAVAAIVPESDEVSLSKALAVGPDDLLPYPFDADDLVVRLDALQQLGRARAVLAERNRTFARFAAPPAADGAAKPAPLRRRAATPERPRVLVVGPASQHKVKVGEALGRALINYADSLEKARGALATGNFDMVVLLGTNLAARRDLLSWPEIIEKLMAGQSAPTTLLVLDAASGGDQLEVRRRLAHLPVADRLVLPQPAELVRARMDFWLAFVALQGQLLSPPAGELSGLCHDGLTSLFNHGYFLEHLRAIDLAPPHHRAMLVIELVNLARLNESAGHAMANRYLAALGPTLRRNVRAEDLPAYLGAGRFAVLLDDVAPGAATQVGRRLERLLGRVPHVGPLAPRLTARSFELGPGSAPLQLLQETLRWHFGSGTAPAAA
jgi:GGDEF domain-containing protein/DNA-binding response OmpR family regulator